MDAQDLIDTVKAVGDETDENGRRGAEVSQHIVSDGGKQPADENNDSQKR